MKIGNCKGREDTAWCSSDSSREQNRLSVLAAKVKTSTGSFTGKTVPRNGRVAEPTSSFNSLTASLMERIPASFHLTSIDGGFETTGSFHMESR